MLPLSLSQCAGVAVFLVMGYAFFFDYDGRRRLRTFLRIAYRGWLAEWAETRARWQGSTLVLRFREWTARDERPVYTAKKESWR